MYDMHISMYVAYVKQHTHTHTHTHTHSYFDPATDPPENFEPGGNRLATAIIYLENSVGLFSFMLELSFYSILSFISQKKCSLFTNGDLNTVYMHTQSTPSHGVHAHTERGEDKLDEDRHTRT